MTELEAAGLRVGLPRARRRTTDRRREIARRYRAAAPDAALAGRPRAPRVPPVRRARDRPRRRSAARAAVRAPACTTRWRSPSSRPTSEFVASAVPGSRGVGGRVRIAAVLPRDDRRRDRGGVSSAPREPGRRGGLGVLPLLQRRGHHRVDGRCSRSRRSERVGVRRRGHRRRRRLDRRLGRRCSTELAGVRAAARGRHPRAATAATAARCSRASPPRRSSGSSTPTATRSTTPPSSSCSCSDASDDVDVVQGYKLRPRRRRGPQRSIGRVYHRFVALLLRAADPRHRLRLPAHPPELARRGRALVDTTGVDLRRAGAQAAGRGRARSPKSGCTTTAGCTASRSSSGSPRSPARCWDLAGLWVELVVLRRGRTAGERRSARRSEQTTDVPNGHVVVGEHGALGSRQGREDAVEGALVRRRRPCRLVAAPASDPVERAERRRRRCEERVGVRRPLAR